MSPRTFGAGAFFAGPQARNSGEGHAGIAIGFRRSSAITTLRKSTLARKEREPRKDGRVKGEALHRLQLAGPFKLDHLAAAPASAS
jgi:hypothetical protein